MTFENQVADQVETAAPTQNTTADVALNQEVATPEAEQNQLQQPDDASKAADAKQRRIDRLTAERYRLRAENEALKRATGQVQQNQAPEAKPLSEADVRRQARELVEEERFVEKCNDIAKLGDKEFKGEFAKSMQKLAETTGPLFNEKGKPEPLMQAVLTTDKPHQVLHYLGNNPEVAEDLAEMTPLQQARKLAILEQELTSKTAKQTSSAPKPLTPAKGAVASAGPDPKADPEGWIKWRNQQIHK
jgi:hypothetical protein